MYVCTLTYICIYHYCICINLIIYCCRVYAIWWLASMMAPVVIDWLMHWSTDLFIKDEVL